MTTCTEYDIIRKAIPKLQQAVQGNIISLGSELLAECLISEESYDSLLNESRSPSSRAAHLVQLVTTKVRQNSENYYTFVRILSKDRSLYADVLEALPLSPQSLSVEKLVVTFSSVKETIQFSMAIHTSVVGSNLPPRIQECFSHLTCSTFTSYQALERLIYHVNDKYDCHIGKLKKEISKYSKDVLGFMKIATVDKLMECDIPPCQGFAELTMKIDRDPTKYTIKQLDELRCGICNKVGLRDYSLTLFKVTPDPGRIIATWLFPACFLTVVPPEISYGLSSFYQQEGILPDSVIVAMGEEELWNLKHGWTPHGLEFKSRMSSDRNPTAARAAAAVSLSATAANSDPSRRSSVPLSNCKPANKENLVLTQEQHAHKNSANKEDQNTESYTGRVSKIFDLLGENLLRGRKEKRLHQQRVAQQNH